ncbi:MAG: hypothetical protein VX246_04855 [Myxococcota bacterium]|nr:hypothetical protein [Myxococcota bacterium]
MSKRSRKLLGAVHHDPRRREVSSVLVATVHEVSAERDLTPELDEKRRNLQKRPS